MTMIWLQLVLGIALMTFGADWVLGGVSRLSRRLHISQFILSALIIGAGSNIPEIIVTILSAGTDLEPLIIPNIVTSNIFNILGIVGLCAVFAPIAINNATKREMNVLLWSTVLLVVMLYDGKLDLAEGLGLSLLFVYYYMMGIRQRPSRYVVSISSQDNLRIAALLAVGIAFLYAGSEVFMGSLSQVSACFNLDGGAIGSLIVAPGTSGPEIIVCILSIIRKKTPILVGNMVGSCIAHILIVAPIAGIMTSPVTSSLDYLFLLFATVMFVIDIALRRKISRFSGFIYLGLLGLYFATILV